MRVKRTNRGFGIVTFKDQYKNKCSLQKSSLATKECVWLGCDEIGLKHFKAGEGWKDIPTPFSMEESWIANTRMHLTRAQVKKLLPHLIKFVETGRLS